jgi:hypothetical protein
MGCSIGREATQRMRGNACVQLSLLHIPEYWRRGITFNVDESAFCPATVSDLLYTTSGSGQ